MLNRGRSLMLIVVLLAGMIAALPVYAQDGDEPYNPVIDPANFVAGVDNPYFPLVPGTLTIYEGESDGETEHIEVIVLHETREVLGIECMIVRDTVWEDGELVEDTFDWYAQDVDGNVWYMGEDSTEYEDGEPVSKAGSWEAGVDGALPGIIMWADPVLNEPYRQEYYAGEAEDWAEVISLDTPEAVVYGEFDALLVTREWTPLEPGIAEQKFYAEGVGVVLEVVVEGGEGRIELLEVHEDVEYDLEDDLGAVDDDNGEDDEDDDEDEDDED